MSYCCTCSHAGFCPAFGKQQSPRQLAICRGELLTAEQCAAYRADWRAMARPNPGWELAYLLAQLELESAEPEKCGCKQLAGKMNRWGPAGCRANMAEIVAQLTAAYHTVSWDTLLVAGGKAWPLVLTGQLSLLDPIGSLVELAIRRAEERATSLCPPGS